MLERRGLDAAAPPYHRERGRRSGPWCVRDLAALQGLGDGEARDEAEARPARDQAHDHGDAADLGCGARACEARLSESLVEQPPIDASNFGDDEARAGECSKIPGERAALAGGPDDDEGRRRYRTPGQTFIEIRLVETEGDIDVSIHQ